MGSKISQFVIQAGSPSSAAHTAAVGPSPLSIKSAAVEQFFAFTPIGIWCHIIIQ